MVHLADLLQERAEMRRQWKKNEKRIMSFHEVLVDCLQRPLNIPFHFLVDGSRGKHDVFTGLKIQSTCQFFQKRATMDKRRLEKMAVFPLSEFKGGLVTQGKENN
jgi:hypothetical protein